MRMIDISGSIENGMWSYADPYPAPSISEIPPPDWLDYPVYSQTVSMAVQTATYLETGAHMYRDTINIDQVALDRCYMIDALMLWIPKGQTKRSRLLIWKARWQKVAKLSSRRCTADGHRLGSTLDDARLSEQSALFSGRVDRLGARSQGVLLGGDTPRYDSPNNPQNFFPRFFKQIFCCWPQ